MRLREFWRSATRQHVLHFQNKCSTLLTSMDSPFINNCLRPPLSQNVGSYVETCERYYKTATKRCGMIVAKSMLLHIWLVVSAQYTRFL